MTDPTYRGDNLEPVTLQLEFGEYQMKLDVPGGMWNPTPHGKHLGNVLCKQDFAGEHVLELGTGCGVHAILIGHRGAASMTLTEITPELLKDAERNLKSNGVEAPTDFLVADWTHVDPERKARPGVGGKGGYDVLVTNPPFAKSGKTYRRYFIDTLILDAHKLVRPGGRLIFVQSSMANIPRSMSLMQDCGMSLRILGETSGPFRDYYYEDERYRVEMAALHGAYTMQGDQHFERLIVFEARLPA